MEKINETYEPIPPNRNDKQFYIGQDPQLAEIAYGFTKGNTDINQIDTSKPFTKSVTVTRTGTGAYTLYHGLSKTVFPVFTPYYTGTALSYPILVQSSDANNLYITTRGSDVPFMFILKTTP